MKWLSVFLLLSILTFCSPKGPQTFSSTLIGKTKQELFSSKGKPNEVRISGTNEIHIYRIKEEFYGKKEKLDKNQQPIPKKIFIVESIYYINKEARIYKYQVWRREE